MEWVGDPDLSTRQMERRSVFDKGTGGGEEKEGEKWGFFDKQGRRRRSLGRRIEFRRRSFGAVEIWV